jgi:hypothetical protein
MTFGGIFPEINLAPSIIYSSRRILNPPGPPGNPGDNHVQRKQEIKGTINLLIINQYKTPKIKM